MADVSSGGQTRRMIESILETALYVDDLDRAEQFYSDVLHLEKIARVGNRHIFYRCGGGVLLLFNAIETLKPPEQGSPMPVPTHGTTGAGHVCFRIQESAFAPMKEALLAADVAIEADFHWPNGSRSVYFRDPAGNSLECAEARLWNL